VVEKYCNFGDEDLVGSATGNFEIAENIYMWDDN